MPRNLFRTLLAMALAVAAVIASPIRAEAETYPSLCPPMTDSITRLYQSFFDRDPDPNGFRHWVSQYQSGESSLAEIAQSFATADEFDNNRFLSNAGYVDWLYEEVLGPDFSSDRAQYWVEALDRGYPRGSVALAFTESHEYVRKTGTAKPLAGYLRWYPKGTHWYCDIGPATKTVTPLAGGVWADYFFRNRNPEPDPIELWTLEASGRRNVRMTAVDLQPRFTDYNWDGVFSGDGDYGHAIELVVGSSTDWIVVFYPRSLGSERLGWQVT